MGLRIKCSVFTTSPIYEGGENMQELINFIIAVSAQVVGNLLCKWLDSKKKDDN